MPAVSTDVSFPGRTVLSAYATSRSIAVVTVVQRQCRARKGEYIRMHPASCDAAFAAPGPMRPRMHVSARPPLALAAGVAPHLDSETCT